MAKKETKVNKEKNKKSFFKGFKAELKKVIWPTPKQLVNNTVAVITIVLITAAIVFLLDFVFRAMDEYGIEKVKEIVVENKAENEASENKDEADKAEDNTAEENNASAENNAGAENNTENNAQ